MPNKQYKKGTSLEYECMYYFIFNYWRVIRSYASKGECDLYLFPPKNTRISIGLGIQCKNIKQENGYLTPKERNQLKRFNDSYSCLVIEVFKRNRRAMVKINPWLLGGKVMEIEDFIKTYYGVDASSWKEWRRMWYKEGIKRKPLN